MNKTGLKGDHFKHTHTNSHKWGRAYRTVSQGKISFLFWAISASLKSLYINTHTMWNKEEELGVWVQLQHYNLTGTTETLQEDSHDWSGAVDGYSLLRKDKPGWQGAGVARYVRVVWMHRALLGDRRWASQKVYESGLIQQTYVCNVAAGAYYTLPDQVKEIDETFFRQLEEASCLKTLGLGICCKGRMIFKNYILQVPEHAGNKGQEAGCLPGWTRRS